jgi:hypothetical protein
MANLVTFFSGGASDFGIYKKKYQYMLCFALKIVSNCSFQPKEQFFQ